MGPLRGLIFEIIGAFTCWMLKGFRGKLSDEMSGPYEVSRKSTRNTLVSIVVVLLLLFILQAC